jgi:16S rRNA (uracil1498-N3)-methyltransferase
VGKWSRRAIEAAKQCNRAWIPTIREAMDFADVLRSVDEFHSVYFADTGDMATPWATVVARLPAACSILVWIGPEGGWSQAEHEVAARAGAVAVRLGPTVLRTETAAIAACAAVAAAAPKDA